ncbi:hypothetical protein WIW50_03555 [Flavobacteriaceae bacterium 3-367]|uniref:TolB family protein n=1 Tax=Eudoraea algarum TaxID=3417568 RepID=UPI003286296C
MRISLFLSLIFALSCAAQDTYQIAYNVLEDAQSGDYEVYLMDMDGSNQRNLSKHPGVDWVYYAFENKIYLLSDRDSCNRCFYLYEMEVNSGKLRKMTDFQLADSWFSARKQGSEFVVKPAGKDFSGFYIINLKGEVIDRISIDLAYINDPAFSPDGKQIVFRGATKASPRELGFTDELYRLEIGSGKVTKLTSHPEADEKAQWAGYLSAAPRWPRDGSISFGSKRNGNYDIYEIDPDGAGLKALTKKENNQVFHSWNDQGFLVFEASMNNRDGYELYLRDPKGTTLRLTQDEIEQYAPVFVKKQKP